MNQYSITAKQPQHKFIQVKYSCDTDGKNTIRIQLPSWRPGRYELGNFAKNVRAFTVTDEKNKRLSFHKITKDCWEVDCRNAKKITVTYDYYAADLNAGSTFTDEKLLYVNPVNCCVYNTASINAGLQLTISVPADFIVACGMKQVTHKTKEKQQQIAWEAKSFHELADSPFIAGTQLQQKSFKAGGTKFNIWFQGECKPDWNKILKDFSAFTNTQIKAYGEFPVKEYHFLIHVLTSNFYHGVEHLTTSVNVLGPSYDLMGTRYVDLLGLCSHELYHSWNIKSIRPVEMHPYDYTRENYFKTGYVAEGVTTFMGDYFLLASGVFSLPDFLSEMNMQMQKHLDNFGRNNYSVAESSYDTWLDGYVPGVPERKVSIYTEGCLVAFMTDILMMKATKNKKRLHDIMRSLYFDFAKKGKGYSESDYWQLIERFSGTSFRSFREKLVDGHESYLPMLRECMSYIGLKLEDQDPNTEAEKKYGIRIADTPNGSVVLSLHPGIVNYNSGLAVNDKILMINSYQVNNDANKWISYFSGEKIELSVLSGGQLKKISIVPDKTKGFRSWRWLPEEKLNAKQKANFEAWRTI